MRSRPPLLPGTEIYHVRLTNLPFPLVRRLFQAVDMIEMPAQREEIVCVGVDHPAIPCRMARDALGPDVNC